MPPLDVRIPSAMIAAMSPATSMIGIVADAFATRTGSRSSRCVGLGPLASCSVRGGPSSLVSRVKIANFEASPGSRASRARSMPFSRDCWYAVRLTPDQLPWKDRDKRTPVRDSMCRAGRM